MEGFASKSLPHAQGSRGQQCDSDREHDTWADHLAYGHTQCGSPPPRVMDNRQSTRPWSTSARQRGRSTAYAAASSSSPTANRANRLITIFSPNSAILDATKSLIVLSGSLMKA